MRWTETSQPDSIRKGYYIASEDEEGSRAAIEWVTGQNRRAESIRASCRGAQKLISRIQQMEMDT